MLSGGIDSPVSGYLAIKRGIKLECIYFEAPPHTSKEAKNKVLELARKLAVYNDTYIKVICEGSMGLRFNGDFEYLGHAKNAYGTVTTISKPVVSRLQLVLIVVMHAPRTVAVP